MSLHLLCLVPLLCHIASAVPTELTNDDYHEARMHPQLPTTTTTRVNLAEATSAYWLQQGQDLIRAKSLYAPNKNIAKNLILFLGDGMSLATLAATRSYIGGEEQQLSFERFPITGLSKTYAIDKIVADSASTATAYLCGVKANYGTIGVNGRVKRDDCAAMRNSSNHVQSLAAWAIAAGKAAGLVTTTRITHASPAGVYAHTAERNWENDAALKHDCGDEAMDLADIAMQLVHGDVGSKLKVVLGGGRRNFQTAADYGKGLREDGRNLIEEFQQLDPGNMFVSTRDKLMAVRANQTKRLLGTFSSSHMDYHLDARKNKQPTLEEMTLKALELLQTEERGYFLFVEGGEIDLAHHATKARIALDETAEFAKAVALARSLTSEDDTLIVVTADHSHTFSLAGYQNRGSDIFGPANAKGDDGQPYLSLSYANGQAFEQFFDTKVNKRADPIAVQTGAPHDLFPSTVPLGTETHGGEDVAVFTSGPWAQLFSGVYEQNTIPHLMAFAACIGEGLKACLQ